MARWTFNDIARARFVGDARLLNEASLGRVYQHVQAAGEDGSLGILTAYRAANAKAVNEKRNAQLGQDIRSLGLGFFKLKGHWRECQAKGTPYKDCPEDQLRDAVEETYAVPGISQADVRRLGDKYEQDAVIYLGPETEGKAVLLFQGGGQDVIGKFSPQKIAQAYSQVRGATFVFEGFEYPAQTFMEATIEQALTRG